MLNLRQHGSRVLLLMTAVFIGMFLVGCGSEKPKEIPGYYDGPMKGKGAAKPEDPNAKTTP